MLALTSAHETPLHRVPAGLKLLILSLASILLMRATPVTLAAGGLATAALYLANGRQFALDGLRLLRPLWVFVVVVALWHLIRHDLAAGGLVILRLVTMVALANLVTLTTRLSEMTTLIDRLLHPLRPLGVKPGRVALALAMVVRFTPVLLDKGQALGQAWRARSAKRPGRAIVLPLVLMALDDADRIADAIKARGGVE